ncbi:GNAT family N-acetyltransferase [Pontibacter qinzhouensis]|uniref:GNAT family N-acetyltransferase n=1 Tax=Pontibacter qinzhouensis TaxID=2603253 RepID=A0A5C8J7J2_9BACT|nr:GNAT family N-acetyltransferase [Pontibacter qinzhouensis]TXK33890.1 GNAT family N-acetyltransferase [Pontibacter qinzhouensis]
MIRPYTPTDNEFLLELLRCNTPAFFAPSEEQDFVEYLAHHAQFYFVVEEAGKILGSGGFNWFDDGRIARISWDIIHPDFQGKGIGKELTLFRLNEIRKNPAVRLIVVRTTQLVFPFYQKLGFSLEKTEKDFWAEGFDLYQLKLEISAHSGIKQ